MGSFRPRRAAGKQCMPGGIASGKCQSGSAASGSQLTRGPLLQQGARVGVSQAEVARVEAFPISSWSFLERNQVHVACV